VQVRLKRIVGAVNSIDEILAITNMGLLNILAVIKKELR
jgi:hypothetical protein